ncbi:MAG: nitroreductase family protein, partial [Methanobacterium sp.]
MDLSEVIMNRRSIRKYKEKEIDDDLINKIVEAGIWAPSAGDLQSWDAVIVKDEKTKFKITVAAYVQDFLVKTPVLIVICANKANSGARYGERGRDLYCIQDAACATM